MSPIAVERLTSEVATDAAATQPARPGREAALPWQAADAARRDQAELAELRARTRAEGFDA